jgi:alkanesulfonate monooxygenase SsuD/methylene tetrahydromethanopterin reductase-like flavin-dependent oxidoreductase (luciferase family)
MDRVGKTRGWTPMRYDHFRDEVKHGSMYVGSPETVAQKIANTSKLLGVARFNMKYSAGTLSHEHMMRCIELFGREVMPRVRALMG